MAKWSLKIEFGGLCMFVVRSDSLVVLMPRTHGTDPDELHHPTLEFGELKQPRIRASVLDRDEDLRLQFNPSGTPKIPAECAPVSEFGQSRVNPDVLNKPLDPTGPVAARFVLPTGGKLAKNGGVAHVHPRNNPLKKGFYTGRVLVTFDDLPEDLRQITIADVVLFRPKKTTKMEVRLVNTTKAQLDCPSVGHHDAGDVSSHFVHYYDLLESPTDRPPLVLEDDIQASPDCEESFASSGKDALAGDPFVDPFACTTAYGCENGFAC